MAQWLNGSMAQWLNLIITHFLCFVKFFEKIFFKSKI